MSDCEHCFHYMIPTQWEDLVVDESKLNTEHGGFPCDYDLDKERQFCCHCGKENA